MIGPPPPLPAARSACHQRGPRGGGDDGGPGEGRGGAQPLVDRTGAASLTGGGGGALVDGRGAATKDAGAELRTAPGGLARVIDR